MKITEIAHCNSRLQFSDDRTWPQFIPAIVWHGHQLTHFSQQPAFSVNCDGEELEVLLHDFYPDLRFIEFACLDKVAKERSVAINFEKLFTLYGLRWDESFLTLFSLLIQTPKIFQKWCKEKSLSARDLAPLRALSQLENVFRALDFLVRFTPSKSEGVRLLEWIVELDMLGVDILAEIEMTKSLADLESRLWSLRYPLLSEQLRQGKLLQSRLPWPKGVGNRFVQHGDRVGIEVKFFSSSAEELRKIGRGLIEAADNWGANE